MNKKITFHYVRKIEIRYDPSRSNGYWYAYVPIIKEDRLDDIRKELPVLSHLEKSIEVTLNGPGLVKARKRIRRQLSTIGFSYVPNLEFSLVYLLDTHKK